MLSISIGDPKKPRWCEEGGYEGKEGLGSAKVGANVFNIEFVVAKALWLHVRFWPCTKQEIGKYRFTKFLLISMVVKSCDSYKKEWRNERFLSYRKNKGTRASKLSSSWSRSASSSSINGIKPPSPEARNSWRASSAL